MFVTLTEAEEFYNNTPKEQNHEAKKPTTESNQKGVPAGQSSGQSSGNGDVYEND